MSARNRRQAEIAIVRPAQPRTTPQAVAGATERRLSGALEVPLEQVVPDQGQPRRDWAHDDGATRLADLAASIREFGVLQPLLVREEGNLPDGRQRYVIIAGGRRLAAAERAGLVTLPIVVRGEEATRVRILQLVENLQRQDLSPIDEARAYQELIDLEGHTPPALAARLHISAQHVRDRLRVLADQVLADAVERRQISATAAREIMKLPDEEVLAFRRRVLAGEHLQTNDVAAARARLAAAGIVNPRRKSARPSEQTPFVPKVGQQADAEFDKLPEAPQTDSCGQTTFVRSDSQNGGERPLEPPQMVGVREWPTRIGGEDRAGPGGSSARWQDVAAGPLVLGEELSPALAEAAQWVAAALDCTLSGERRDEVVAVLGELSDQSRLAAWWLLVDAELRERLARDDRQATTHGST